MALFPFEAIIQIRVLQWQLDRSETEPRRWWVAELECGHRVRYQSPSPETVAYGVRLPVAVECKECARIARAAVEEQRRLRKKEPW